MNAINNGLLDNLDENINFDATNPFYQFLEKQAAEFQLFGDRLKCELQNSYREFIKQQQQNQQQQVSTQNQQQQQQHDVTKVQQAMIEIGKPREPLEKISNESPSPSVDSLKARIEELETDSIIRNQDIEKQKAEIQYLKQELDKFNNFPNLDELESMKKEIKELNDFKNNFTLLFNSFEELKLKLQQRDIENDRLLAEQLQNEDNTANLIPVDSNDSGIIDGSLCNGDVNNNTGPVGYPSNVNTMTSTMTSSISPRPPRPLTPHSRPSSSLSRRSHRFNYNNNPFGTTSTQNLQNNDVRASYGDLFDTPTTNDPRTNSFDTLLRTPRRHVPVKRTGTYSHFPNSN